jgi:translation initiation factor IF-3
LHWSERRIALIAAEKKNRVNDEITAPLVRVIDAEGNQVGVIELEEAVRSATEAALDLVEIQPNAEPPVCRLMDYGKFQFQANKRKKDARKKQQLVHLKEVKFRPGTDEGDYQVKLRNLRRFLGQGDKAKVTLWFRGREMAHQELGLKLLRRVEADLDELAKVEQFPKLEGRRLSMVMSPRK